MCWLPGRSAGCAAVHAVWRPPPDSAGHRTPHRQGAALSARALSAVLACELCWLSDKAASLMRAVGRQQCQSLFRLLNASSPPSRHLCADTIMDCDRLLVLSAGRLVEQGSPARLAKSGGVFARLVAAARRGGADGASH